MNIGTLDFEVLVRDGQLAGLLSETRRRIQDFTHAVEQGGAGMDSALREFHSTEKAIVKEGAGIGQLFRSVGQSVGIAFSATAAINFAKQVVNVRAEMQALEQSFAVLLGSEDKAVAMLADLKQFEIESPLDTKAVAQGAQMMLAFGVEADKVTETIRRIGDVSMGSTEKFQSLVLSFSQMNSIGHLISNDVRQMATAGFNPLAEMARTTGKSMEELNAQMADGAISAEMVADAFRSATSEGGQFYGMTRKQAEGISGLQAQLEGALREAFNEIGKSQEGIIAGGYKMATSLVENYEKAGRLLVALIAAYGTYRTALLLVTAATKMHVTEQVRSSILDARGAAIMTTRTVATHSYGAALWAQIKATRAGAAAQAVLNAVMKVNPYVLLATAVVGFVTAMWALHDSTTAQERALKEYNAEREAAAQKEQEHKSKIEQLINTVNDEAAATYQRVMALDDLKKEYPSIFKDYDIEKLKLADILKLKKQIAELDGKRSHQDLKDEAKELRVRIEKLKAELARGPSNPMQTPAAFSMAINSEINKLSKKLQQYNRQIEEQSNAMWEANTPLEVRRELTQQLIDALGKENSQLDEQIKKQKELNKSGNILEYRSTLLDEARFNANKKRIGELEARQKQMNSSVNQDAIIKSKTYWDNIKKEAEEARAKLDPDDTKTKAKWDEYTKKIAEADAQLKKWETSGDSVAAKAQREAKEEAKAIKRRNEELLEMMRKAQADRIALMEDEEQKEMAKIEDAYTNEIAAIEKKMAEWSEAQKGPLTVEQTGAYDEMYQVAFDKRMKAEADFYKKRDEKAAEANNEYLREYGSYQEKILGINEYYNKKIAEAKSDEEKKLLNAQRDRDISETNAELAKKSKLWQKFFGDLEKLGKKSVREMIAQIELLLQYGNGDLKELPVELAESFAGLDDGSEKSQELIKELIAQLEKLRKTERKIDEVNPFRRIIDGFDDLSKAAGDSGKEMDAVKNILSGFGEAGSIFTELGQAMEEAGMKAGKVVVAIGDVISKAVSMAGAGASIGQGWGAVIGAVVGAASALIPALAGSKGLSEETRHYYESLIEVTDELIDKQLQLVDAAAGATAKVAAENAKLLNELKRERVKEALDTYLRDSGWNYHSEGYEFQKRLISYITSNGKILNRDLFNAAYKSMVNAYGPSNVKEWDLLSRQLEFGNLKIVSEFLDTAELEKNGIKIADILRDTAGTLTTYTADQLRTLKTYGIEVWSLLDDETQKYLDSIIEIDDYIREIERREREGLTGTTEEAVSGSLDKLYAEADLTFEKIGESFEEHIKKAILNMVSRDSLGKIQDWYAGFAKDMEDGILDPAEAESLRKKYKEIAESGNDTYQKALDLIGITMGEASSMSPLAGAIKGASQEEINALTGYMNNTMINQREATELIRDQLMFLANIDGKLGVSNKFLESIDGKLTPKSDPLRAMGIG